MTNITHFPSRPEAGRITLQSAKIHHLKLMWAIHWVDVEGREHVTYCEEGADVGQARTCIGLLNDNFYEFLGEPRKVIRR